MRGTNIITLFFFSTADLICSFSSVLRAEKLPSFISLTILAKDVSVLAFLGNVFSPNSKYVSTLGKESLIMILASYSLATRRAKIPVSYLGV